MAGVLDALASYVQNMLMEMAKEEVHMLLGVSEEIRKMGDKLGDLKNFLADADRRNITDLTVQAWVRELRGAMYEATDILDLCQLKAMEQGPRREAGCFNPLLFCMRNPLHAHDIGSRIKNLNQRLQEIKTRSMDFGFIDLASYEQCNNRRVASSHHSSRETSGEFDESNLVGEKIEEDTRKLVQMLIAEEATNWKEKEIKVFAIVGVGGIGKSTLAKKIFNHDSIGQEFPKKIWLSVNQDFSEIDLLRRTITEAGGDQQSTESTRGALERTLKEVLKGHKTLLIMDDVWNHQAWDSVLKTPLVKVLGQGSRVLITTRDDRVARGTMAEKPYHRVGKLDAKDAWSLLKKQVVGNENDERHIEILKDIGMAIVAKFDCLPLAVKVVGGLLRQKRLSRGQWENVLNNSIWSVPQVPEELNYAIYLSYEDLHPRLRPCFLHFSLLPKSIVFHVDEIVGMWISEGFVHGTSCELEEIGKEYYDELILRNLIEPDTRFPDNRVCNIHDVVRSFAQYVARDEALVSHNSAIDISGKFISQNFIRLSLENKGSKLCGMEWCSLQAHTSLRTLISVGYMKTKPGDSLVSFSHLRILYVAFAKFGALAESLYQLKHLRFLSIRCTDTSRLPENISKLKLLQYIDVAQCKSFVMLPGSIAKLQQLRYLNLVGTSTNNMTRGFHGLTNLRNLYGFLAHMDGDWCSLEELGPLSQLTGLDIRGLENVSSSSFAKKSRIAEKVRLGHLYLQCTSRIGVGNDGQLVKDKEGITEKEQEQIKEVFDELCPPPYLESLRIIGYFGRQLPRWLMSTAVVPLGSLRILTMGDLACCTELPNGLCQLPCLELLRIRRTPYVKHVGLEFLQQNHRCHNQSQVALSFPRLREMLFHEMVEWEEWEWEVQVKAMPILESLELSKCKLRRVPPGLAFHARALKELYIYDVKHLSSLENFTSVVLLHVFRNTDLERISNLPKLHKLIIVHCPKLKVLDGVPALQRLDLKDYGMETVPRYMQDVNPRYLVLHCSFRLLTSIAAGKSGPEWDKLSHIQQVNAYARDDGILRKCHVLYRRDHFRLETNISRSAIGRGRKARAHFPFYTCPIEDEWPVGRQTKHLPLCVRFRCNAYRHLVPWLHQVCLHCSEAARFASSSDQWTEAAVRPAVRYSQTRYGWLQQQKETPRV